MCLSCNAHCSCCSDFERVVDAAVGPSEKSQNDLKLRTMAQRNMRQCSNLLFAPFLLPLHPDIWEDLEREFQILSLRELAFSSGGRAEPMSRLLCAAVLHLCAHGITAHD